MVAVRVWPRPLTFQQHPAISLPPIWCKKKYIALAFNVASLTPILKPSRNVMT